MAYTPLTHLPVCSAPARRQPQAVLRIEEALAVCAGHPPAPPVRFLRLSLPSLAILD